MNCLPLVAAASTELMSSQEREAHKTEYLPMVVKCVFPEEVGDATGGTLFLRVLKHRGYRLAHILTDDDWAPVLYEPSVDPSLFRNPTARLKTKYAVCGAPMRANVNATILREWILYHLGFLHNDVKFVIYAVEVLGAELTDVLDEFAARGALEVVHALDQSDYESWYYNQILFINDCLQKLRHVAEWAFSIDYDEFLFVRNPDWSVSEIVDSRSDKAGVIFWRVNYSVRHCLPAHREGAWATEQRAFRAAQNGMELPEFLGKTCPAEDLRCHTDRFPKWVANLKNVLMSQIHFFWKVVEGVETERLLGYDFYAVHFRAMAVQEHGRCEEILDGEQSYEGVFLDRGFTDSVSKFVKENHLEHTRSIASSP